MYVEGGLKQVLIRPARMFERRGLLTGRGLKVGVASGVKGFLSSKQA